MGVSVGFAVESDDAAVVDDAVDDGGGHVAVAEHVAPSAELCLLSSCGSPFGVVTECWTP